MLVWWCQQAKPQAQDKGVCIYVLCDVFERAKWMNWVEVGNWEGEIMYYGITVIIIMKCIVVLWSSSCRWSSSSQTVPPALGMEMECFYVYFELVLTPALLNEVKVKWCDYVTVKANKYRCVLWWCAMLTLSPSCSVFFCRGCVSCKK